MATGAGVEVFARVEGADGGAFGMGATTTGSAFGGGGGAGVGSGEGDVSCIEPCSFWAEPGGGDRDRG